jgi:hypothetical protein
MLFLAKFVTATLLVAASCAVVLLWLLLLVQAYSAQSGLMPWVAAGIVLYGLIFVGIAAVVGLPGILWARSLAVNVPPKWRRLAQAPSWVGTTILVCGLGTAVLVLVAEQFRPKDPNNGCVSWRSAEASAAMAAGGPSGVDCPARK